MEIVVAQGDLTGWRVDAIVNAAGRSLLGGRGVDGAIHAAGGPEILAACRQLRRQSAYRRGLSTGDAVATTAGELPARWVIHTVGPVYSGAPGQDGQLRSCYLSALRVADEIGASTVAFPLISAGAFGWPKRDAIVQALAALRTARTAVARSTLVLFDDAAMTLAADLQ